MSYDERKQLFMRFQVLSSSILNAGAIIQNARKDEQFEVSDDDIIMFRSVISNILNNTSDLCDDTLLYIDKNKAYCNE